MSTTRRNLLRNSLGLAAGASVLTQASANNDKISRFVRKKGAGVTKGRINQSVVSWCFAKYWRPRRCARWPKTWAARASS